MRAPTAAVALPFALVACGADSTFPDMTSASGDYALRTVNNVKPSGISILIEGDGLAFRYIK